jgi:regulator of nucleoside diphosphate kinase
MKEEDVNQAAVLHDPPPIRITPDDLGLIDAVLGDPRYAMSQQMRAYLRCEVDRAEIVEHADHPDSFVRIGSTVLFEDEAGRQYNRTLMLPHQTHGRQDGVSIIAPVGIALLGLAEGQAISFATRDGRVKTLRVLKVSATR